MSPQLDLLLFTAIMLVQTHMVKIKCTIQNMWNSRQSSILVDSQRQHFVRDLHLPRRCQKQYLRLLKVFVNCVDFSRLPEFYTSFAPVDLSQNKKVLLRQENKKLFIYFISINFNIFL